MRYSIVAAEWLTSEKLLDRRKEGFGVVALDGVGVNQAQYLFRKIPLSREQQNLHCWIKTLE